MKYFNLRALALHNPKASYQVSFSRNIKFYSLKVCFHCPTVYRLCSGCVGCSPNCNNLSGIIKCKMKTLYISPLSNTINQGRIIRNMTGGLQCILNRQTQTRICLPSTSYLMLNPADLFLIHLFETYFIAFHYITLYYIALHLHCTLLQTRTRSIDWVQF